MVSVVSDFHVSSEPQQMKNNEDNFKALTVSIVCVLDVLYKEAWTLPQAARILSNLMLCALNSKGSLHPLCAISITSNHCPE